MLATSAAQGDDGTATLKARRWNLTMELVDGSNGRSFNLVEGSLYRVHVVKLFLIFFLLQLFCSFFVLQLNFFPGAIKPHNVKEKTHEHQCKNKQKHIVRRLQLTVAQLHSCTVAQLHSCTVAQLHSCTVAQLHMCYLAGIRVNNAHVVDTVRALQHDFFHVLPNYLESMCGHVMFHHLIEEFLHIAQ
jgi:hypothetical protein